MANTKHNHPDFDIDELRKRRVARDEVEKRAARFQPKNFGLSKVASTMFGEMRIFVQQILGPSASYSQTMEVLYQVFQENKPDMSWWNNFRLETQRGRPRRQDHDLRSPEDTSSEEKP